MKTFLAIALVVLAAVVPAAAQLPKIIDREVLFGNPEYAGAQISPDGKYIHSSNR